MKKIFSMKTLYWVALAAVLLVVGIAQLFRSGAGVMPQSNPSVSSRSAFWLGVLEQKLKVKMVTNLPGVRVTDAWIEQVVLRYESVPIRRKLLGKRLCIRFEFDNKNRFIDFNKHDYVGFASKKLQSAIETTDDNLQNWARFKQWSAFPTVHTADALICSEVWPTNAPAFPLEIEIFAARKVKAQGDNKPIYETQVKARGKYMLSLEK